MTFPTGVGFQNTGIIVANILEIVGAKGRILIYNPTIGKGMLIGSWTGQGFTDSKGNVVPAGFNIGVWDAVTGTLDQHLGIDDNGNLYLADATGTTKILARPDQSLIAIGPDVLAGSLALTMAAVAGTQGGTPYDAGFESTDGSNKIQIIDFEILFKPTGFSVPGIITGNAPGNLNMLSPEMPGGDAAAGLSLISALEANPPGVPLIQLSGLAMTSQGIVAYHPASNVPETWQNITLDAGWSQLAGNQTPQYRLSALQNKIELKGRISHAALGASVAINSGAPLPAAYRPGANAYYRNADANAAGVQLGSNGILTAYPGGAAPTSADLTGIVDLNS